MVLMPTVAVRGLCRRLPVCFIIAGICWTAFAPVSAQEDRSHRLIESPQLQGMDFVKQMELLQRLQTLAGRLNETQPQSTPDAAPPNLPDSVTPEDLQKFRNLMTRLGIQPPAGRNGGASDILPGAGGKSQPPATPEDSERQRLLEELLRRLSGEQPEIKPMPETSQKSTPPPRDGNSNPPPSPGTDSGRGTNGGVTMRSRRDGSSISPGDSQPLPNPSPDQFSGDGISSRFFGDRPVRRPTDPTLLSPLDKSSEGETTGNPQTRQNRSASGEVSGSTIEDIERRFSPYGNAARNRPGQTPSSLINPEDLPSEARRSSGLLNERSGREVSEQMRQGRGPEAGNPSANPGLSPDLMKQIPDWLEALRRLEANPVEQSSANGKAGPQGTAGESTRSDPSTGPDPQLASLAKAVNESQSLQELGRNLRNTLTEVSNRAKQQTRQESQEKAGQSSWGQLQGLKSAAQGAIASLRETMNRPDLAGGRTVDSNRGTANVGGGDQTSKAGETIRNALSPIGDVARSANQWVMSPPTPATPPSPSDRSPTAPASGESPISWSMGVGVLATAAILFWLWNRRRRQQQELESRQALLQMGHQLQSREDIIRIYHALAARSPAVAANWWPHQWATEAMAAASPDREVPIGTLSKIYERARYLPEETVLSESELVLARAAVEQCVTA